MAACSVSKLLVTGATGLVGSRFVDLYKNNFTIQTIGRENVDIKIDLTSEKDVVNAICFSDAEAIINFAAYTSIDAAEGEKDKRSGEVYTLNALLPLWLLKACKKSGKSLYHISTDYVFGGKKDQSPYTEKDLPCPVDSWYSISKFDGEINVQEGSQEDGQSAIIRISYPYSSVYNRKLDFVRVIIDKLKKGEVYFGCKDQKIKPASVDDIAQALALLINKKATGIYHVAGKYQKGYTSPYDFAIRVAQILEMNVSLIKPIPFLELSKKRVAPRPRHTWLDTKKIESLGFTIPNLSQALERFKQQLTMLK